MRDHDPTTWRYMQADPLGLVDGASVYGYALQNPGRYVDPRGEAVEYLCRPIMRLPFYIPPAIHCAVFVTPDSNCDCDLGGEDEHVPTIQFSLEGGARGFDLAGTSREYRMDREYYSGQRPGARRWIVPVPPGMSSCEFDSKVIEKGKEYQQGPYSAVLGPNSNTAAANIIRRAGGNPPRTYAQAQNHGIPSPGSRGRKQR